jgi:transcriptional regulator with XRE-family HTH domain
MDEHVGRRLRERRTVVGMSQERLGVLLGVTFQQIQKYERGVTRIGSGRLYQIGRFLDVPLTYFFEDAPSETEPLRPGARGRGLAEEGAPFDFGEPQGEDDGTGFPLPAHRDVLELVRAYQRISDPAVRKRVGELVRALANATYRDDATNSPDA